MKARGVGAALVLTAVLAAGCSSGGGSAASELVTVARGEYVSQRVGGGVRGRRRAALVGGRDRPPERECLGAGQAQDRRGPDPGQPGHPATEPSCAVARINALSSRVPLSTLPKDADQPQQPVQPGRQRRKGRSSTDLATVAGDAGSLLRARAPAVPPPRPARPDDLRGEPSMARYPNIAAIITN